MQGMAQLQRQHISKEQKTLQGSEESFDGCEKTWEHARLPVVSRLI